MMTRLKKVMGDNKLLFILIPLLISWAVWTTNSVFSVEKKQAVTDQCVGQLCEDISEIKHMVEDTRNQVVENKEEILKLLLSINREVKTKR